MLVETPQPTTTLDIKLRNASPDLIGFARQRSLEYPSHSISAYIKDLINRDMRQSGESAYQAALDLHKKLGLKPYSGPDDAVALVRGVRDESVKWGN